MNIYYKEIQNFILLQSIKIQKHLPHYMSIFLENTMIIKTMVDKTRV
jgi:hypothetical protein